MRENQQIIFKTEMLFLNYHIKSGMLQNTTCMRILIRILIFKIEISKGGILNGGVSLRISQDCKKKNEVSFDQIENNVKKVTIFCCQISPLAFSF